MQFFVLGTAAATVLCLVLLVLPLVWNPRGALNRALSVQGLLLGLWSVGIGLMLQAPGGPEAYLWYRIASVGSILNPPAVLWLILTLAGTPWKRKVILTFPFFLLAFVLLWGNWATDLWYSEFRPSPLGMVGVPANLPAWVAFAAILVLYVWAYVFFNTWTAQPTARLQWIARTMGRALLASIGLYLVSLGCELVFGYPAVSGLAFVLLVSVLFRHIFRYGLLDRKPRFAALDLILGVDSALAVAGPDGRIVKANPAFDRALAAPAGTLAGRKVSDLFPGAAAAWIALAQGLDEASADDGRGTLVLGASRDEFGDLAAVSVQIRGAEAPATRNLRDFGLSDRERAIAVFLSQGLSNREIADRACIAQGTVRVHVYNIYRKTGASNRVELVRMLFSDENTTND